ncbi:retrovirus-related pol polyprotein from transposon TNT 1-94 [Tanacetum coccineum]
MVMLEGAEEQEIQGVVRTTRDLNAIPPKVIKCYNCKGEGHYTKQCTLKKRVKDSEWFKEKMLIAPQQEAGIKIAEE